MSHREFMEKNTVTPSSSVETYNISQYGACPAIKVEIYANSALVPSMVGCDFRTVTALCGIAGKGGRILACVTADVENITDKSLFASVTPELLKASADRKLACACSNMHVGNGISSIYDEKSGKNFIVMKKTDANDELFVGIDDTRTNGKQQIVGDFLTEVATYLANLDAKRIYHSKEAMLLSTRKAEGPTTEKLTPIENAQAAARKRLKKVLGQDTSEQWWSTLKYTNSFVLRRKE